MVFKCHLNKIGTQTQYKPYGLHAVLILMSSDPSKFQVAQRKTRTSGGSRKKYLGGWPLSIWEATTAKRNYYRTN